MMTNSITIDQARALAALVATMRPDWATPGILKTLSDARTRGTAWDLAHAALHAAENPRAKTPAVIALAGEHWTKGKELGTSTASATGQYARCERDGHEHEPAHACRTCRSEQLAADGEPTHQAPREPKVPRERVREILATAQTPAYRE